VEALSTSVLVRSQQFHAIHDQSDEQMATILQAIIDHLLLREGIAAVIEDQPDMTLVTQAANGREGIEMFRQHRPDATLMDLRMPDMSGIQAISAIRAETLAARIIVLTTYAGDVQAVEALRAGASGYLLKNMLR
jgi:DNA-binding NarL/FixJ family response regulator